MVKKCALSAEVSASHTLLVPWKASSSHFLSPRATLTVTVTPNPVNKLGRGEHQEQEEQGAHPSTWEEKSRSEYLPGKHWDTHGLSGPGDNPAGRVTKPPDSWGNWGCEGQAISPRQCREWWDQDRARGALSDGGKAGRFLRGSDLPAREISISSHKFLPLGIRKTQR